LLIADHHCRLPVIVAACLVTIAACLVTVADCPDNVAACRTAPRLDVKLTPLTLELPLFALELA